MSPIVFQAIGVVLILFFIFLLVMCWKTWRFTHVFFMFLVFGGAITFMAFASLVLKTQNAWRSQYESLTAEVEKAEADKQLLLHGELTEVKRAEDSIYSLVAKLDDLTLDRGRVWRGCRPLQAVDNDTVRVSTVPANHPQGTPPPQNGLQAKDIVYAFAESQTPEGWRVPSFYLGEFTVDASTGTEVTVSRLIPLDPDQIQKIQQGGASWALYEMLPLDSHDDLAEWDEDEKLMLGMEKEQLGTYVPNLYNWPADRYDAHLDKFYRYNREAAEDDPPQNVWAQVKFVKEYTIQVDADVQQSLLDSNDSSYFDPSGRAIEGNVRRGDEDGTVSFKVGDIGVFDLDTADTLIADGICEKVKSVYRRDLHDYQHFFRESLYRHEELDDTIARVKRDTADLVALEAKAKEQINYRGDEKVKLEEDLVKFRVEQQDVTNYANALEAEWSNTRSRLSQLYAANYKLMQELTEIQYRLTDEINRRAREATAQAETAPSASLAEPEAIR